MTMKTWTKTACALAISLPLLAGCVTPGEDDANAATKQGAVGGALLGLTLGALTGDAELAAKGAVAGGVAGGVAGAAVDIESNRNNIRHDSRNEAISNVGTQSGQSQTTKPQTWDELNNFTGEWNVSIRNHNQNIPGLEPIQATGSLSKTTQADVHFHNDQGVDLTAKFSYTPDEGYQFVLDNNANNVSVNFAGEYAPDKNRYQFYPTNINDTIYKDIATEDIHLELSFAGSSVWMIDAYAFIDGKEQKIQTFRFTQS